MNANESKKFNKHYLRDQIQDNLDTFNDSVRFSTNKHHPVSRVRTTLLEELNGGLSVLVKEKKKSKTV